MTFTPDIAASLLELPRRTRAGLALELIDSLGEEDWSDEALSMLAEERDAELESGAVRALSYEEFLAGIRRPGQAE